jgi:hypothetical protein
VDVKPAIASSTRLRRDEHRIRTAERVGQRRQARAASAAPNAR